MDHYNAAMLASVMPTACIGVPPLTSSATTRANFNSTTDPSTITVSTLKRSDDDIQFISSKPVKRRKISEQKPELAPPQQSGFAPVLPGPVDPNAMPLANYPRELERRVSTGMVGLPSDLNAMELTSALRGVSLPVLENFVLDQPIRRHRPVSSPELSPKQLPTLISPAMLASASHQTRPQALQATTERPGTCHGAQGEPADERIPVQAGSKIGSESTQLPSLNQVAAAEPSSAIPCHSPCRPGGAGPASSMMAASGPATSPFSAADTARDSTRPGDGNGLDDGLHHASHHHCQVCSRMRQQAQFARGQGLPVMAPNLPGQLMPHIACHQPFGQHIPPQMMAMAANNMHPFGPGFAPFMMPLNGNAFAALPPTMQASGPQLGIHQTTAANPQSGLAKASNTSSSSVAPAKTPAVATATAPTSSPAKPPPSLVKSTHRKPSPNLIVDIVETCQEKFPFEEVAKRHNVPLEKVHDVFSAIIQVPLLRCPTDRRRAGRVATARVKEFNKTKKEIQEARSQGNSGGKADVTVTPADVAQRLGRVEFPEGFNIGGH
ncbi:hypothetical protein F4780DRAFT_164910 [Xylariomycetidae sp. FL0641]|nr:hypothetical protein F4780DRAFT_164910 [Xylariomycetidae sp. FL0641]